MPLMTIRQTGSTMLGERGSSRVALRSELEVERQEGRAISDPTFGIESARKSASSAAAFRGAQSTLDNGYS